MSEKQETIGDIVAEMHDESIDHSDLICFHEDGSIDMANLADRLEAACKHEKELLRKTEQLGGNAAAMREALCEILYVSEKYMKNCPHISGMIHTGIASKCRIALAAPQRNCDRFNSGNPAKDAEDAYDEWQQIMPTSCKDESLFRQWLFGTPDEKKGGKDE